MTPAAKFLLTIVSLLSSLVLWVVVRLEQQPQEIVVEKIPVQVRNLPRGLTVLHPEEVTVTLKAEGPEESLNRIPKYSLQPFIDASNMGQGLKQVRRVQLDRLKADERVGVKWTLQNVQVNIEKTNSKLVPVEAETVETPKFKDLNYDGCPLEPEDVTIYGPISQVNKVRKARVTLNLGNVERNQTFLLDVELVDINNNVVQDVSVDPPRVTAKPIFVPAPQTAVLPIQVNYSKNQPDFGYQIKGASVTPTSVVVTGSSEALARREPILTEPIDLRNLHQTTTLQVRLKVPPGLKLQRKAPVRVKIVMAHIPNSSSVGLRPDAASTPEPAAP